MNTPKIFSAPVTKSLHQDLAEIMGEVGYLQMDSTNDFHKYKYASARKVLGVVNAELSKRGICVSSSSSVRHYEAGHAVVHVQLRLTRGDEYIAMEGLGEGADKGDKAIMKAMTAAVKYALSSGFLISWGNDPEADSETDSGATDALDFVCSIDKAETTAELEALVPGLQALTKGGKLAPSLARRLRAAYDKRKKTLTNV